MSFLDTQTRILQQCTYETTVIVAPGAAIVSYKYYSDNFLSSTLTPSVGYFASCLAKAEFTTYFRSGENSKAENFALDLASGVIAGSAYMKVTGSAFVPSAFMSTAYTLTYNYLDRPYVSAGVFVAELGTELLCTKSNPYAGAFSGLVFVAIDLLESTYTNWNSADKPIEYHNTTLIHNLSDQCFVGEAHGNG